jgi:uncharacterized phiE125 gp8 family phage protein
MSYSYRRFIVWHHPDLHARLTRLKLPDTSPLELSAIVLHLRLDPGAENGPEAPLLESMLAAAIGHLEHYCSVAIMHQDWRMTLHEWPPSNQGLELPHPPFAELLAVRTADGPIDIAEFIIEPDDRAPAVLYPVAWGWPQVTRGPMAIGIDFRCGRETAAEVPADIKQALLLAIAFWYEQRESSVQFQLYPMIELGWQQLLGPYRQEGFA